MAFREQVGVENDAVARVFSKQDHMQELHTQGLPAEMIPYRQDLVRRSKIQ